MIDTTNINRVFGAKAVGPDGDKIGTVKQVYVDDNSGQPAFATVATGLFGTSESFVPLQDAEFDGENLHLRYDKDTIKDAPRIDPDGELSVDEQATLFDYYGLGATAGAAPTGGTTGYDTTGGTTGYDTTGYDTTGGTTSGYESATGTDAGYAAGASLGEDTTGTARNEPAGSVGSTGDDAMTRSEERLNVGKEQVPVGRARLRKHIVTEQQSVTVPVQHEEVTLEREPITDANVGDATSGPDLTESEHEVTLNAERPVVDKETVPVERVRLGKDTVTDQENVTEDVAHEEIELDDESPRDAGA